MFEQVCGNGEARGGDGDQSSISDRRRPNKDIHKGTCT